MNEHEQMLLEIGTWVLSARSAIDIIVYARKRFGQAAGDGLLASPPWAELRDRLANSLIVVCEPAVDTAHLPGLSGLEAELPISNGVSIPNGIPIYNGVPTAGPPADAGARPMPHGNAESGPTHAEFCAFLDEIDLAYFVFPAHLQDRDRLRTLYIKYYERARPNSPAIMG